MIRLDCKSQQYAWGKKGSESVVAQLLRAASRADEGNGGNPSISTIIKEDQPYAEFWMGTHPNCPSLLAKLGQTEGEAHQSTLATWLQLHPEALGSVVQQRWPVEESKNDEGGRQLPFLFKVLSISQALSIQAHPDRSLGRILRDTKPQHYPDDNHKPEMALAVTPCEVLCGFRTVAQMALLFRHAPEFARVVGQEHVDQFLVDHESGKKSDKEVVKPLFDRLMRADPAKVAQGLTELQTRLSQGRGGGEDDVVQKTEALMVRLSEQFPGDVGCFVAYFLNHLHLVPGQAVFLGPNVPHAYINGDMVECMASSDNTVRAGLTPKFKDVDTLVEMLTYKCGEPDWVHPTVRDGARVYSPPVEEFVVSSVSLDSESAGAVVLPPCDSFGLVLVYDGEGIVDVFSAETAEKQQLRVAKGQVYGLAAGHSLRVAGHLTLFKANVNCERAEGLRRSSASATSDVSSAL